MNKTVFLLSDKTEFSIELQQQLGAKEVEVRSYSLDDSVYLPALTSTRPDLIVLDSVEQELKGLSVCKSVRTVHDGPFVLLSSDDEAFILLALQLGVDITLPAMTNTRVIAENLYSLLFRLIAPPVREITSGNLQINAQKRDAYISGNSVQLSTIEFDLLWYLSLHAGQVISREELHQELYKSSYNGYDRSIDLYVSRIRQKIGDSATTPSFLKTVRGIGYQFVGQVESRALTVDTNCYVGDTLTQ